jgi:hypothetical protein
MAVDIIENLSELISVLPPGVAERVGGLITVLKAVGIAFIIYVIYVVIMAVVGFRRSKKLKVIDKKIDSIDKKLDKLLKGKSKSKKK